MPGMTIERMLCGTSVIRNPVLARVFQELGHVEQWGTGIPEVMAVFAELGRGVGFAHPDLMRTSWLPCQQGEIRCRTAICSLAALRQRL